MSRLSVVKAGPAAPRCIVVPRCREAADALQEHTDLMMARLEAMAGIFGAIGRLASADQELRRLAEHGQAIAMDMFDEADCFRANVEGLI